MHFPIIRLTYKKENKAIDIDELKKSPAVQQYTDYIGHKYSDEERKNEIGSEWFKNFFDGIAEVDANAETVTFHSEETIKHTLEDYFSDIMFKLSNTDQSVYSLFFYLRHYGTFYKHSHSLFDVDGVVLPSMAFVEDTHYFAGQTFYVGDIYDAHF